MQPTVAALRTVALSAASTAQATRLAHALAPVMLLAVLTAGCQNIKPYVPPSEGHISAAAMKTEPDRAIPPPARVSEFVPPPKPTVKPQTYSVVVNEVPVKDLLLALARDTKQNIDIHPGLTGLVSLNAINETLPAILERVSKQVNMRYRMEGNTIVVSQDTAFVKTYRVNYVNMTRDTTSTIGVSGELSTSTGSGSGPSASSSTTSGSNTVVRSVSNNNFWDQMRDNIRSILNSTRLQSLTTEARAERLALVKQEQEMRVKQLEAASRAGQGAPALATTVAGATTPGQPMQSALLPDDVIVNAVSGTVTVNATERQHQLVQQHIDSIVSAVQRQVLIEATIVEVALSEAYQGGIDWSKVAIGGGFSFTQTLLGGFNAAATAAGAAAGNAFTAGYANTPSSQSVTATLKLLQEFGNTRVLSSPKLMALNNQTALLKVVDNLVYFEIRADTTQGTNTALTTFNTTAKTVAVGVVMGVTPQINEDGRVILTVRPTITRLRPEQRFVNDPNPNLCDQNRTNCIANPVPQIQVREMESVLQVGSGQTIVLGGLMQDDVQRSREQIPGADSMGSFGELLRFRNERAVKTELVVFLRPTIVTNPSLESDDLRFFQRFLPRPETPPQPPEKTGAVR